MLYNTFRAFMMIAAFFGTIVMIEEKVAWEYVFFPFTMIIWGIYSFFIDNDKEYRRRNNFYQDEYGGFYSNPYYQYSGRGNTLYSPPRLNKDLKLVAKKCKRNFKVTIDNDDEN